MVETICGQLLIDIHACLNGLNYIIINKYITYSYIYIQISKSTIIILLNSTIDAFIFFIYLILNKFVVFICSFWLESLKKYIYICIRSNTKKKR